MARVAGLSPVERTGTGEVDRAGARPGIAPNRPAPDLNPRAAPVSIYSTPEDNTQAAGANLRQVAASLAQLNPALERYAQTTAQEDRTQYEAAAENKIG